MPIPKLVTVLRSSARDVLMIVTGILIAFFLDAWWNDQIEQRELRETMRAVYSDFSSTRAELDLVMDSNVAYIDGVTTLISLGLEDLQSLDAAQKSKLTGLLPTGGITFDPVLGSVDALISSGQLNKVRNIDIRNQIASWTALMDEIGEDQTILIDMYMAQQERSVELGVYLLGMGHDSAGSREKRDDIILKTVIEDGEMLNRLAAHRFAVISLNDELRGIDEQLSNILALLEKELGMNLSNG
jgi:hypothetical protein